MRILLLTSELPFPPTFGGAKLRSYQIMKNLHGKHEITLVSFLDSEDEIKFEEDISKVCSRYRFVLRVRQEKPRFKKYFLNPYWYYETEEMHSAIRELFRDNDFDIIHLDAPMIFYKKDCPKSIPKIVCPADSRSLARVKKFKYMKRIRDFIKNSYQFYSFRNFEKNLYKMFDACVTVTGEDKDYIKKLCPKLKMKVIPSGIDLSYFKPRDNVEKADTLLFTGTMDYRPNIDAAIYFSKEIFPLIKKVNPGIKFFIVGKDPSPEVRKLSQDPNIIVTGFVDDIRPYLAKASVFICPMRLGSGIKNKVLEAMACGKAIVATPSSVQGIGARDGKELMVAGTPIQFSESVIKLLKDNLLRSKIGRAARGLVESGFNLDDIGIKYEQFYESIKRSGSYVS